MSAPESHYKAKYPRTYEASFVALSMVDGRELWCVDREVCAQIEAEHAALLSQVARLRDSLKAVTDHAEQYLGMGDPRIGGKETKLLHQARALLAETEKP